MIEELQNTLHLHEDDVPWVSYQRAGVVSSRRMLHVRPDEDLAVTQLRCDAGVVGALHRHHGPVFALTESGTWGHDTSFRYRHGTYVYETPGVVHRFLSGPESVTATFISIGNIDILDDDGALVSCYTPSGMLAAYFEACEAQGLPRPDVLE
jgi:quercetin dioxygenase-like cupin family protein